MANTYFGNAEDFIFDESATYEESSCKKENDDITDGVDTDPEVSDDEMNEGGVIECVDDPEVAAYRIALENEQNYNMIMNAFMIKEMQVLESTGQEMVYEAVDIKKFFSLVAEQVQKWWSKIKGIFKKLVDNIMVRVNASKAFIKKYKGKTFVIPTDEFKGYEFGGIFNDASIYTSITDLIPATASDISANADSEEKANAYVEKYKKDLEDRREMMRGAACGDLANKVSADKFDEELKKAYFGEKGKHVLKLTKSFDAILSDLENAKKERDGIKKAYKSAEEATRKLLGEVKKAEREVDKKNRNSAMKVGKCVTDGITTALTVMSRANSMQSRAFAASVAQTRAMAVFYVSHQPEAQKQGAKNESAVSVGDMDIVLI